MICFSEWVSRFTILPPCLFCCSLTGFLAVPGSYQVFVLAISPAWNTLSLDLHMVYFLTFLDVCSDVFLLKRPSYIKKAILLLNPRHSLFPLPCFTFSEGLITTWHIFVIYLPPLGDNLYKGRDFVLFIAVSSAPTVLAM